MPLYLGHKNTKGLSVSPALQSLGIDLLRAPPSSVGIIARPLVVQHGYASYVCHLPAFLKAYTDRTPVPFNKTGYPVTLGLNRCIDIGNPPLVVDFKGPIPSKHIERLNEIGFERIRVNRTDNIVRFPSVTFEHARDIRNMNPNATTPAPVNTVNLQSFEMWVLTLRLVSNLLCAHTYPAFADDGHKMDEYDELTDELLKRKADSELQNASKRTRAEAGVQVNPDEIELEMDVDDEAGEPEPVTVKLSKAKPPRENVIPWGSPDDIPNTSGLFFPFVPELCSYDKQTVPDLIERYLVQSLGDKPERQIDRMDRLRSAWGVIGQTDAGNVMSHLCKIISLCLSSQSRAFPIVVDNIYQGCIMSGARLFCGMNGSVYRPIPYDKLQEETSSYHMHSRVLDRIMEIVNARWTKPKDRPETMRSLREVLLETRLDEENRDEITRAAVHLHFKEARFLAINAQSLRLVIDDLEAPEDGENMDLPLHHSALFSRDKVFVALSAFGYQAPSFMIENCPKVSIATGKVPNTLVVRQKPLDLAVVDWKKMMESKEIRNNPRNLSRANRDRSLVGNDKTVVWGALCKLASDVGGIAIDKSGGPGMEELDIGDDGVEGW